MKKATNTWLIAAAVLVIAGALLFTWAMQANGWDFSKLSTVTYTTATYEPEGDFDRISIEVDTTRILFTPAQEDICRVVCVEAENQKHTVAVADGVLQIRSTDNRKWYEHIGVFMGSPEVTVYLPENEYAALSIETDTGDITIAEDFTFGQLSIEGDTCDVDCFASVSEDAKISLSTGDLRMESVTVKESIRIQTDTGNLTLTHVACKDLAAEIDTGNIRLKDVIAADSFSIESDTGNVQLDRCDAAQITIHSDTGNVTGTLLSEKVFITETATGSIRVPKTTKGGRCEITTATGNIKIDVTP